MTHEELMVRNYSFRTYHHKHEVEVRVSHHPHHPLFNIIGSYCAPTRDAAWDAACEAATVHFVAGRLE